MNDKLPKQLLLIVPILTAISCGSAEESSSNPSGFFTGPYFGISKDRCIDFEKITIIDNFHTPPNNIVIDVPSSRDCQFFLTGTETLFMMDTVTKKPWNRTNSYNVTIQHKNIIGNKCLTFGKGGGIRNVSWQPCNPKGDGSLIDQNSQTWSLKSVGNKSFRISSFVEYVMGIPNPKERCLNLGPAPKFTVSLGACDSNASAWKFFSSGIDGSGF